MTRSASRPRLLVLNQYYWPAVEADGQLLAQLCEDLADEYEITVITGRVDGARAPGATVRGGVRIIRVPSTTFHRRRFWRRTLNYVTYGMAALPVALARRPPDAVLSMTSPPFVGDLAYVLARRFRAPFVVVTQDLFPEVAEALGQLDSRPLLEFLRRSTRLYLQRADRIVAIGETMRTRLEAKGAQRARVSVIENWVDTRAVMPHPRDNPWSREHGLAERFVVMHSGNVGHVQDLDTLVRAATLVRDLDDLVVAIVGGGAAHADLVRLARELDADNVRFLPYQPASLLSLSLSSAAVHVVGLAAGLSGYVVPSRIYGILAAGRPVIVAADEECDTVHLVRRAGCGAVVPPRNPEALAHAIREAYDGRLDLDAMGARAREFAVAEADREIAVARYRELLREVRGA